MAHDFCEKTGVSALAVAIGNAHGDYPVAPELAFDILEEINHKAGENHWCSMVVQVLQMMILGRPYR